MEENIEESETQEINQLVMTEDIRSYFYDTAKWTKFISIVGFVIAGLVLISAFNIASLINNPAQSEITGSGVFKGMSGMSMTIFFFLYALIIFYPSLLLFKYSNSTKQAVLYGDQEALSAAAQNMKTYFKFAGIFTIIAIVLYLVFVITVATRMMPQ